METRRRKNAGEEMIQVCAIRRTWPENGSARERQYGVLRRGNGDSWRTVKSEARPTGAGCCSFGWRRHWWMERAGAHVEHARSAGQTVEDDASKPLKCYWWIMRSAALLQRGTSAVWSGGRPEGRTRGG
jgi:hypothetical protein